MEIRCERRVLANGLPVIVHEDHTCPMVAVNVWYHVGSKNERPGRTGFAHLFEHLMFEGSAASRPRVLPAAAAAGALLNGSTNADRTNYWEVVPTGALDLALWMESDRMGYLLPALTEAKFANQRDVVLNERRQNYENRPYGLAGMAMLAALFPPDHPYHWLTIGVGRRSPRGDARRRARVLPALLPSRRTRRWRWPATSSRTRPSRSPSATSARSPPGRPSQPGAARGAALRGDVAAGPRGSRRAAAAVSGVALAGDVRARRCRARSRRRPARERQDVAALSRARLRAAHRHRSRRRSRTRASSAGFFQIVATAAPGRTLRSSSAAIVEEIARLADEGPDRRRAGARPGAGRGAVRLPAADRRRLRRQVRSAERLQRVPRRSRLLRCAISSATPTVTAAALLQAAARVSRPDARVSR